MKTIKVDCENIQEKEMLLAFLDALNYHYEIENNDNSLSNEQMTMMGERKDNFLAGKTSSRSWEQIKQKYNSI